MCIGLIYSCGHTAVRKCDHPRQQPASIKVVTEGKWWNASQLSMPSTTFECTGVSEPPTEIKQSCYKCVSNKAAQIKDENAQEVEKKMRERTGAGNDSYMYSLSVGENYDENGRFICIMPADFVNITMLGKKPWNQLEHFARVGKTCDQSGHVVDRADITPEQKILQYQSAYCIAQRNASMGPEEMGSLNPAYAGMSTGFSVMPLGSTGRVSPVSTRSSSNSSLVSVMSLVADDEDDTPLTACFSDGPTKENKVASTINGDSNA